MSVHTQPMALHQLTRAPSGLSIAGPDPFVVYYVTKLGISGRNAGLLRFRFSCIGQTGVPRLQVFWWGDDVGSAETYSLDLSARPGVLIVPLDASSLWTSMKRVAGVRIDLQNPVCAAIKFEEVKLYSRDALDD